MHMPFKNVLTKKFRTMKKVVSRLSSNGDVEVQLRDVPLPKRQETFTDVHLHGKKCVGADLSGTGEIFRCTADALPEGGWLCGRHIRQIQGVSIRNYSDEPERIAAIIQEDKDRIVIDQAKPLGRYRGWE